MCNNMLSQLPMYVETCKYNSRKHFYNFYECVTQNALVLVHFVFVKN